MVQVLLRRFIGPLQSFLCFVPADECGDPLSSVELHVKFVCFLNLENPRLLVVGLTGGGSFRLTFEFECSLVELLAGYGASWNIGADW